MDSYCYRREREISNPSFSSTLLDAIYRSIDEAGDDDDEELVLYRETMRKKHSNMNGSSLRRDHQDHILNFQRACMIEKWMEKKVSETKVVLRRNSTAHVDTKSPNDRPHPMMLFNSTSTSSSSSDSSSGSGRGGGFSSSEAESVYYGTVVSSRSSSSCYGLQKKPKPIRTNVSVDQPRQDILINNKYHHHDRRHAPQPKPKQKDDGSFSKTKSRALKKIYGDLKKVKQPISPGGRLASFLNSLFTAGGNTKKAKISSANEEDDDEDGNIMSRYSERKLFKSANASISSTPCSSASSFSRSCLSKTPSSSRGKSGGTTTTKRSVRFYPVSVIVDEDCQPCGQKSLYEHEKKQSLRRSTTATTTSIISSIRDDEEINKFDIMEKNRRVEEGARDLLLRNYQESDHTMDMTDSHIKNDQVFRHVDAVDEEDEEDDAASYASSDLFELDNLSAIGMERYREELPVYETTHLDTNRAIANGFIL